MTFSKYALLSIILTCILYGGKGIIECSRYLTLDWWFTTEQLRIKDDQTYNREITPLARFAQTHPDWNLLVITYEEEDCVTIDGVEMKVIPAYKWMLSDI